jgi:NAD(P)-dependent dehydrogenase (short-subunit alcohol dehydrogenase family)
MNRLLNNRALITGGTTGIGFAAAKQFIREGARVAVTGASPVTLDAAKKTLGESALVHSCDAGNVAAQKALAQVGMPNTSVYGAGKAARLSLTKTFSGELIDRGIRVNAVSPGPIATPLYDKLGLKAGEKAAASDALRKQIRVHRFGDPDEVAHAFVYLASDESLYTVGSELAIDGGMSNL